MVCKQSFIDRKIKCGAFQGTERPCLGTRCRQAGFGEVRPLTQTLSSRNSTEQSFSSKVRLACLSRYTMQTDFALPQLQICSTPKTPENHPMKLSTLRVACLPNVTCIYRFNEYRLFPIAHCQKMTLELNILVVLHCESPRLFR